MTDGTNSLRGELLVQRGAQRGQVQVAVDAADLAAGSVGIDRPTCRNTQPVGRGNRDQLRIDPTRPTILPDLPNRQSWPQVRPPDPAAVSARPPGRTGTFHDPTP